MHDSLPHPAYKTLLASAARTTTQTLDMEANHDAKGVLISVVVTAIVATPILTPKIQYTPDPSAAIVTWIDYAVFTALAPAGETSYSLLIYPGLLGTADGAMTESVELPLPRFWRLVLTVTDADSATYAVYAMLL